MSSNYIIYEQIQNKTCTLTNKFINDNLINNNLINLYERKKIFEQKKINVLCSHNHYYMNK